VTNFFFPWECFLAACDWIFFCLRVFLSCCTFVQLVTEFVLKSVFSAVAVAKLRHSHKWWWRQFRVLV
jgi:hypothetical protein